MFSRTLSCFEDHIIPSSQTISVITSSLKNVVNPKKNCFLVENVMNGEFKVIKYNAGNILTMKNNQDSFFVL